MTKKSLASCFPPARKVKGVIPAVRINCGPVGKQTSCLCFPTTVWKLSSSGCVCVVEKVGHWWL